MPKAVVYCRVSTDDQVESGAGLDAQLDACRSWCERHGHELAGPFVELEGVSGATPLEKRIRLVEAVDQLGPGDVLLISKRDRLARDPIVAATIEALIKRKKARVVSAAGEGSDDDEPGSVLMRRMVDAFAEYERLIIGARTRAALAAKKRRGERTGRVPFGKRLDVDDPRRSRTSGEPVALVDAPDELETLRRIELLRSKGYTFARIVAHLNLGGHLCRGRQWQTSAVHHLCVTHGYAKGFKHDDQVDQKAVTASVDAL